MRVGDERPSYRRAPRRNEVLGTGLGYDSARIEQLSAAGGFGP